MTFLSGLRSVAASYGRVVFQRLSELYEGDGGVSLERCLFYLERAAKFVVESIDSRIVEIGVHF
jgi:hypothetical protein